MSSPKHHSSDYQPLKSSYADFDTDYDTSNDLPPHDSKGTLRRTVVVLLIITQVAFDILVLADLIYTAVYPRYPRPYPLAQNLYC